METAREAIPANTLPTLLRPLSIAEILDLAITLYRRNFATLVGISAVVTVPLMAMQVVGLVFAFPLDSFLRSGSSRLAAGDVQQLVIFYAIYIVAALISAFAMIYMAGATTIAASERYMGRPTSIKQAYLGAFRRWFHLLVGAILFGLANALIIGSFLAAIVVASASTAFTRNEQLAFLAACLIPLACISALPLTLLAIYMNTRWAFWVQSIAIEGHNGPGGLGRSWRLVAGSFLRVLGTLFLLSVFMYVVTAVPTFAVQWGSAFAFGGSFAMMMIANTVVSETISTVVSPLLYIVLTVLYYDLRIRKEGLDLQMRIQSSPAPAAPSPIQGNA